MIKNNNNNKIKTGGNQNNFLLLLVNSRAKNKVLHQINFNKKIYVICFTVLNRKYRIYSKDHLCSKESLPRISTPFLM